MAALSVTALAGVALLEGVAFGDDRGELRKVVRREETERAGLELVVDEVIVTVNETAGTVRGMHLQVAPFEEAKTLWVNRGRLLDVLVDARPEQPTYGRWAAVELAAGDGPRSPT
jgi:dTDP-4-dehydrorhamnose 3,5-epimerase